jgi:hypothetical protein
MIASEHRVLFFTGRYLKISVSYRREAPIFLPAPENEIQKPFLRLVPPATEKGKP